MNFRDVANTTDEAHQASDFCETCALRNISKKLVPKVSDNKATQKLESVYSDVIGTVIPSSIGDNRYAITFIDKFSGYAVVKFMQYNTQALQTFNEYVAQYGRPRIWRTDNGTDYKNKAFKKFCMSNEIAPEFTFPETPEQNGVAERFNRTVVEAARCLLIDSKLPKSYCVQAVDTACYARNLVVKDKNTKSAFEKLFGGKPRSKHLKIFGCVAYSKNRNASKKSKFDPNATNCLFIGYSDNTTAYLLQNLETRQIFTSRNVRFNENNLPGFYNETEDIEDSFLYLVLDEVREKLQDTSNSSEISSEVELTETGSVQESEDNKKMKLIKKLKKKMQVQASNQNPKIMYSLIQMLQ